MVKTTEQITITAPIGTKDKCVALGINMSFHSSKALAKEIERIEWFHNNLKSDLGAAANEKSVEWKDMKKIVGTRGDTQTCCPNPSCKYDFHNGKECRNCGDVCDGCKHKDAPRDTDYVW